ncbi:hypothetical protein Fmac_022493 [Flemingia macrophylla]|uniref:Senescence domain-containing protein n=1 Tax=Flemingia macrophylla TaxID=520843 RepID=A0ABD1LZV4_9FABA
MTQKSHVARDGQLHFQKGNHVFLSMPTWLSRFSQWFIEEPFVQSGDQPSTVKLILTYLNEDNIFLKYGEILVDGGEILGDLYECCINQGWSLNLVRPWGLRFKSSYILTSRLQDSSYKSWNMFQQTSFYPRVDSTNPDANSPFSHPSPSPSSSSSSSMYPSLDAEPNTSTTQAMETVLVTVPGAILHLIQKDSSVHLASGDLSVATIGEGDKVVAVLARVGDEVKWPLAKDVAAVKLDASHYFFTVRVPQKEELEVLNYGLTVAAKGQERALRKLDEVLEKYCFVSKERVEGVGEWEVLNASVSEETSPEELRRGEKREAVEEHSGAYWTTLAPNVEDYSGRFARWIAAGSGQVVRGILWVGDVTVERLKWGNAYLKKRLEPGSHSQISPQALERIKWVKKLTKMSENVATGVLSGVVKVSAFFTSSLVNSKAGKKFFSLLPGEIVLASLDGFNKVCDAVEVAGRNVMSTSSVVTTGLVSHKYGEQAAQVTNEGLDAAGHAIGTAWAVFKLRKALNPKSVIKPTTLAKAAAESSSSKFKTKKQVANNKKN